MHLKHLAALVPLSVLLCGTDIQVELRDPDPNADLKYSLEVYVHDLEALVALQIAEISRLLSDEEATALQAEHYEWRLQRDIRCREKGLHDEGVDVELECLSAATEEYFVKMEDRLEALQSETSETGSG